MLLSTIDEISVEPGRYYEYAAWVRTDLDQGNAYLAVTFWRLHNDKVWKSVGEPALTELVADTQDVWTQATGVVQAPSGAQYARVEATLGPWSTGSVRFDDVFLGLGTCLDIGKSGRPHYVVSGQLLTYTIIYNNIGREKATNVQVIETYDPEVNPILELIHPHPSASNNIWNIGDLLPGRSGTITAVVQVHDDAKEGELLRNSVELLSNEENPAVAKTHTHVIPSATCDVYLDLDGTLQLGRPGQEVSYVMELLNMGNCAGEIVLTGTSSLSWGLRLDPPSCTLPIDNSRPVTLSLSVPPTAFSGARDITSITATLVCSRPYGYEYDVASDRVTTGVPYPVYLPVVMRNFSDTSTWESEDNNYCGYESADGPLLPEKAYYGYTNDCWDWFRIEAPQKRVAVDVTIYTGSGVQVMLGDPNCEQYVSRDIDPTPMPGGGYLYQVGSEEFTRYYLGVYTESDYGFDRPYVIRVVLP